MAIEMYDPSSDPNSYKIIVWWSSAKVPKTSNSVIQLETSMSTDFYVLPCRAQVQNFISWSWCHSPAQVLFYHISLRASHQLIWASRKQWSTWCNCVNWCLQLQKRGNTPVRLGSWITTNCTHCRFAKVYAIRLPLPSFFPKGEKPCNLKLGQRTLMVEQPAQEATKLPASKESLIANHTASAVLAMQQNHVDEALEALSTAVGVEMAMPYGLPPNWSLGVGVRMS